MNKPIFTKLPAALKPFSVSRDYACGSYEGKINFSCSPYGPAGNIDGHLEKKSLLEQIFG